MRALFLFVVVAMLAPVAHALERGETCTLKASLPFVVNQKGTGRIETVLEPGTDVTVVVIGDEGYARITTGDATGSVATSDLEAACAGTLQTCQLDAPLVMYEKTRSDAKSWRLKPGAVLSVLRSGSVWAHVRIEDLEGFVKAPELKETCKAQASQRSDPAADPAETVVRGDGPGVLFLPPFLDGAVPAGEVDLAAEHFAERLAIYRPDAVVLGVDARAGQSWKTHIEMSAQRANATGLAYVIVSKASIDTVKDVGVLVWNMVLVDAKTAAVLKGVRVRPSTDTNDLWAELALSAMLPFVGLAPGAKVPLARLEKDTDKKTTPDDKKTPPGEQREAQAVPDAAPWFANPYGYVALGATLVLGGGAAVFGGLSMQANDLANATTPLSAARGQQRADAWTYGITSDALTAGAVVFGITTLVVFIARAGMDDRPAILKTDL